MKFISILVLKDLTSKSKQGRISRGNFDIYCIGEGFAKGSEKYTVFHLGQTAGNYKQKDRTPKENVEVRSIRQHDAGMINSSPCRLLTYSHLLYPA